MVDAKSKSQERREAASQEEGRDGLSTFYYPELGRSVRAKDREAADKLVAEKLDKEAGADAAGEDKAE